MAAPSPVGSARGSALSGLQIGLDDQPEFGNLVSFEHGKNAYEMRFVMKFELPVEKKYLEEINTFQNGKPHVKYRQKKAIHLIQYIYVASKDCQSSEMKLPMAEIRNLKIMPEEFALSSADRQKLQKIKDAVIRSLLQHDVTDTNEPLSAEMEKLGTGSPTTTPSHKKPAADVQDGGCCQDCSCIIA